MADLNLPHMNEFNIDNVDFSKGLVPAIVQDFKTKKVLMLGYMNREALEATLESGKVTFYSRSKERLWTKGETSENYLNLKEVQLDCDHDTLLVYAKPDGPVCHKGTDTCWGEVNEKTPTFPFLKKLEKVIEKRLRDKDYKKKSYIKRLSEKGSHKIAQKVGEEAVELVIEAGKDNDDLFLEESADLFFHFLILLHDRGYSLKDVLLILSDRNRR